MKRMIALMLAIAISFTLAACAEQNETQETQDTTKQTDRVETSEKTESEETTDAHQPTEDVTLEALMSLEPAPADDFSFFGEAESGYTIESYRGDARMLAVPEEINGGAVVEIDNYVFGVDSPVEAIRFADTTVDIGRFACIGNVSLSIVVTGVELKTIGYAAFQDCTSLETLVLNDGLEKIDEYAFFGCIALESVTIPSSVKAIDLTSFMYCHEDFTIHGESGSYAETFAAEQGIPFVAE